MNAFNPSFIDKEWTILQQLEAIKKWLKEHEDVITEAQFNEFNEKLNTLQNDLQNVYELSHTNEIDIGVLNADVSSLENNVSELNQEIAKKLNLPITPPTIPSLVGIGTNGAQYLEPITYFQGKLYLHTLYIQDRDVLASPSYSIMNIHIISSKSTTYTIEEFFNLSYFSYIGNGYVEIENKFYPILLIWGSGGEALSIEYQNDTHGKSSIQLLKTDVTLFSDYVKEL